MKKFDDLSQTELHELYGEFVIYRDKECGGHAQMTVQDYYKKHHEKIIKMAEGKKQ